MRFASLEHFGLSPIRLGLTGAGASGLAVLGASTVLGAVLGPAKNAVLAVIALLVFYIVLSTPRRLLDSQRVSQARESVFLSAAASACLDVTGSRPRTVLLLRSRDPVISRTLAAVGSKVLLGTGVSGALASSSRLLSSHSATTALEKLASLGSKTFDSGDEEARGLAGSDELSRETKLPVFMTASFFTPIMLLLYAVFSHAYAALDLIELVGFEFIILDLAFYFSSADSGAR